MGCKTEQTFIDFVKFDTSVDTNREIVKSLTGKEMPLDQTRFRITSRLT